MIRTLQLAQLLELVRKRDPVSMSPGISHANGAGFGESNLSEGSRCRVVALTGRR